jgi:hypothetical protein
MERKEGAESAAQVTCAIRCTGRRGTTLSMKARKKKGHPRLPLTQSRMSDHLPSFGGPLMISSLPANLVRPPKPASPRRTGSGGNTGNAQDNYAGIPGHAKPNGSPTRFYLHPAPAW